MKKTMREEFCAAHYRSHDAESTGVKQGNLQPLALTLGFSTLARPLRLHSGIRRLLRIDIVNTSDKSDVYRKKRLETPAPSEKMTTLVLHSMRFYERKKILPVLTFSAEESLQKGDLQDQNNYKELFSLVSKSIIQDDSISRRSPTTKRQLACMILIAHILSSRWLNKSED